MRVTAKDPAVYLEVHRNGGKNPPGVKEFYGRAYADWAKSSADKLPVII